MLKLRGGHETSSVLLITLGRRYFFHGREPQQPQWMDEYSGRSGYPNILDLSFTARKMREREIWNQQTQNVVTVEEKLIKLNMPRYYGYKVVNLGDRLPYNCLPATQYYTRTIFTETNFGADRNEQTAQEQKETQGQDKIHALIKALGNDIKDSLEYISDFFRRKYRTVNLEPMDYERRLSQMIVEQVNRLCINVLSADYPHLKEIEIDYNPRHEAFWSVGGIEPPKNVIKSKEGRNWQKEMAKEPVDRQFQYTAQPYLAVRHQHPLSTWEVNSDVGNTKTVPVYNLDPRSLGYTTSYRHGTNVPGYWPSNTTTFACISFQSRAHMKARPAYGEEDFAEVLHAQGILSSFSWLLAQANYFGFNTVSELTYPFNTQTVITNGRDWSFYEYQLNTLLMHSNHLMENPKVNYCRGTPEMQLYKEFDESGRCVGFNENVIQQLVRVYTNVPSAIRAPRELMPFLPNPMVQRIADYEDSEKRHFLENTFKHITSNRPRHLDIPELYLWEKIYKIDNKTRALEPKRRFFEVKVNPWKRTLDQRCQGYIPRALRTGGSKSKDKYRNTYYP